VSIRVQRLKAEDLRDSVLVEALEPIGRAASAEYGRKWNADHFFWHWHNVLEDTRGFFFVAFRDGQPVGVMTGQGWPDDFSGEPTLARTHWYVIPEARGTYAALRLWRAFENLASKFPHVYVSCPLNVEADQTSFYTKRGFKIGSRVFEKA
jgi:hypothetical protein